MTGRVRTDQQGFTLVELMMAAFVLVVGILGVVTLVDRANGALGESNSRVGATNHARELVEHARSFDYDDVTTGRLPALLRAKTGAPGVGTPWTVVRRGVRYTVAVSVCLFDDPVDGLAPATFTTGDPDRPLCARPAAVNAKVDSNPDDFRRLQIDLSWRQRGKPRTLRQDALIVNPSGGLGPRILTFPEPANQFTAANGVGNTILLTGITSTVARTVAWNVAEGGGASGNATAIGTAGTDWSVSWPVGTPTEVMDGAYRISVQAFNDLGVAGDLRWNLVYLNRAVPVAPTGVTAGRNGTNPIVDVRWSPNREPDVIGYIVKREGTPVCGSLSAPLKTTSCIDAAAPAGTLTYTVTAVDYTDLKARTGEREGTPSAPVTVAASAVEPPPTPVDVVVTTEDGLPKLRWTQPAGTTPVAYYRIYRDGTTIAKRYSETVTAEPFWIDSNPGTAAVLSHVYYVAAVSAAQSESPLTGGTQWP